MHGGDRRRHGQHTVADIARIAAAGAAHPGKLLLGSRTFDGADVPPRSRVGNRFTSRVFGMITRRPVNDTQTGLRRI
uniref:CAZy families GT2 protein n=1 Tax=uncultured Idiomarina sp. TaxID=352961 RepID=A0A060CJB9_9GAMM|nr:CAZy families GT2 protein [uncultured Idiomarina sp.]